VANYQQPDFRNPVTPGVSMQIEAIRNVLQTTAADPRGCIRSTGRCGAAARCWPARRQ